jgi:hypothetical protein
LLRKDDFVVDDVEITVSVAAPKAQSQAPPPPSQPPSGQYGRPPNYYPQNRVSSFDCFNNTVIYRSQLILINVRVVILRLVEVDSLISSRAIIAMIIPAVRISQAIWLVVWKS